MRDLTPEEFDEAPHIIQVLYMHGVQKMPVGMGMFDEAVDKHPEYFPETNALREKWATIPEEEQKEYRDKLWEISQKNSHGLGIIYSINNPDECEELFRKSKEEQKPIHEAFFKKHGISHE